MLSNAQLKLKNIQDIEEEEIESVPYSLEEAIRKQKELEILKSKKSEKPIEKQEKTTKIKKEKSTIQKTRETHPNATSPDYDTPYTLDFSNIKVNGFQSDTIKYNNPFVGEAFYNPESSYYPNFGGAYINSDGTRKTTPEYIILHQTGTDNVPINTFTTNKKGTGTSAHVVVSTNGKRTVFGEADWDAWHAGNRKNLKEGIDLEIGNKSIAIEMVGNANWDKLTPEAINSTIEYIIPHMIKYSITTDKIKSHRQINKGKADISDASYKVFMDRLKEVLKSQNLEYLIK